MDAEHGTHNELPEEPSHEPVNTRGEERVSNQPDEAKVEEEKPATPANESEIISQTEQEEPGALPIEETGASAITEEAETSTSSQQAENLSDEQVEASEVTEVVETIAADESEAAEVETTTDDALETAEIEPEAASLPAEQTDMLAAAGVPARQKSKYTPWMQIVAVVVLICVVGGIVFAVRQSPNGHGQTVLGTPTPIPPLTVTKWCTIDVAAGAAQNTQVDLSKVEALSANDAWVLGTLDTLDAKGNISQSSPLLEYWNGYAWRIIQTADTSALVNQLQGSIHQIPDATASGPMSNAVVFNDMAVLSDKNIWIVGHVSVSHMFQSKSSLFPGPIDSSAGQPLIEHWDGHTWQIVASPAGASPEGFLINTNQLTSISAISANDIWAMGMQTSQDNAAVPVGSPGVASMFVLSDVPLVEHWDGTSWKEQQLPTSLQTQGADSASIQALSSNDVWSFEEGVNFNLSKVTVPFNPSSQSGTITITGASFTQPTFSEHIIHWDGQNWNELQFPADLSKTVSLNSVSVIADNNIWAFGSEEVDANGTPIASPTQPGKYTYVNVVYHWDGTTWSKAATPDVAGANLKSVSVIAPDDYWLFGSTQKDQPLTEHWDGKTWRVVTLTTPTNGSVIQVAAAGQRAWALVEKQSVPSKDSSSVNTVKGALTSGSSDDAPEFVGMVLETNC